MMFVILLSILGGQWLEQIYLCDEMIEDIEDANDFDDQQYNIMRVNK